MSRPINILIVEDNLADAVLLKEYLKDCRKDINIDHVSRLIEAIQAIVKTEYDILFLDLSLPDSSGMETYALLKIHYNNPLVILTGCPQEVFDSYPENPPTFLEKGEITPGMLKQVIKKLIKI